MYTIAQYGEMIRDRVRTGAYAAALKRHVGPDTVVLDLGCGTGIFALLACQLGARHVYAIEPDEAIEVAKAIAYDNGYGDRITFYRAPSTQVELPGRAHVIVADLRGTLPLFRDSLPSVVDARQRLMAPGGTFIPRRDTLYIGLVEAAEIYRQVDEPWKVNPFGLNMLAGRRMVSNNWWPEWIEAEQLLAAPQRWYELDYKTVMDPNAQGVVTFEVARQGTAHGLAMWFDCELTDGVTFSGGPGQPQLVFGHAFFPLTEPVEVVAGDQVRVQMAAGFVGDQYEWRWQTIFHSGSGRTRPKAAFSQSTAFGRPLSPVRLRKGEAGYRPQLSAVGQADRMILELMDGQNTVSGIAARVQAAFPKQFPDQVAAERRVARLSLLYG